MAASRLASALLVLLALAGAVFAVVAVLAWHPALDPVQRPATRDLDPAFVRRGSALALLGNCAGCHDAPGRSAWSGGLPIRTPFGTVYSSNITPDPETGIGRWSAMAFRRAMREGIDREGRNLYPAFPYDHYTAVTDADDDALYAYLMTRRPARAAVQRPALPFPLDIRAVVAGWNLLFLRPGPYRPDLHQNEAWNRGAYLVEGLGHCGACHTPRNALGAEDRGRALAGGMAEGWNAYALDAASPAPVPWTVDTLSSYLRHGFEVAHGVSRGPMALVTADLGAVPEADVHAMAVYLVSLMGRTSPEREAAAPVGDVPASIPAASAGSQVAVAATLGDRGAALYAEACASCHDSGRPVPYGGLALGLSSALHAPDPSNIVTVVVHGLAAPPGEPGAIMPGFANALDDGDIAALLRYLRADVAHEAPWPHLDATVRAVRSRVAPSTPSDGVGTAPALTGVRIGP